MDEADVLPAHPELELPQGLDERGALDVANGPSELYHTGIGSAVVTIAGLVCDPLNPVLDLVGDVGYDLHGLAEVIAPALAIYHRRVHLACGDVVIP